MTDKILERLVSLHYLTLSSAATKITMKSNKHLPQFKQNLTLVTSSAGWIYCRAVALVLVSVSNKLATECKMWT